MMTFAKRTKIAAAALPRALRWASIGLLVVQVHSFAQTANQTAGQNFYRIAGVVTSSITGEPIRHATIFATAEEGGTAVATVQTDAQGRFAIDHLPQGKYPLNAARRGYRSAFFDEHDNYNSAIVTGPDQDTTHLSFRLVPSSVLYGLVLAESGDPVENAQVMLFRKVETGKPGSRVGMSESATTDDTGAYEFADLAAGEYMMAVIGEPWYALHHSNAGSNNTGSNNPSGPPSALDVVYPVTYYDSTPDESSAGRIVVAGGSRNEVNVNLHAVPALHFTVNTPRKPDGSIARAELRQTVFGSVVRSESQGFFDSMDHGSTEFEGVAPGHYELVQGEPPRITEMNATSNQDIDPQSGTASVSVRGTLRNADGTARSDDCAATLDPIGNQQAQASIQTQCIRGSFRFQDVPAGDWQLSIGSSTSLPIASIQIAGGPNWLGDHIKVGDKPLSLEVTVMQDATRVQGFALRNGKGASGAMIVLIPTATPYLTGLYRRDQSDSDGSFALRDVIPGRYTIVAIDDGWSLDWADAATMARYLPGGASVTVTANAGKAIKLAAPLNVQNR